MKIRLGDKVQILAGKDKGRESVVSGAFPAEGKVTVEGYNIAKRHTKPISAEEPGGIIDKEMKMDQRHDGAGARKDRGQHGCR